MMHIDLLRALLPPSSIDPMGPALNVELTAEGNALDQAQWSADQILLEADPRTCVQTLTDWERVYGLPEACQAGVTQSIAARRAALVAKVSMIGGQSPAFFIALAAALGYVVTITEWRPFTTEMDTEQGITDEQWEFIWQVNSALYNFRELTTEDDTEMALAEWGNTLLECVINRYKPAHTYVLFSYS
jgi:uncharacterized protein YmfQ (DUF2313 family)